MQPHELKKKHLLIMAGGTGGHIFPGLALFDALPAERWQVSWLGGLQGLEAKLIPNRGINLHTLPIQGLRGKGKWGLIKAPFRVGMAIYKACQLFKRLKPDVVIGFGGYASGPGGIAAWLLGIPFIIHEQNAIAGLTNRILARFAKRVLQAFPNTLAKGITVGNPIRNDLLKLSEPLKRLAGRTKPWRLLVMGGSRGAVALNKAVVEGLALLSAEQRPEVWHQTGAEHFTSTQKEYQAQAMAVKVEPFIDDMAEAYAWADLVICRAGAITVSELAAVGMGSILVPYPYAVDDHQTANANFLERQKAAIIVSQSEFTPERFVAIFKALVAEPQTLQELAQAAYQLRQTEAVQAIKQYCEQLSN